MIPAFYRRKNVFFLWRMTSRDREHLIYRDSNVIVNMNKKKLEPLRCGPPAKSLFALTLPFAGDIFTNDEGQRGRIPDEKAEDGLQFHQDLVQPKGISSDDQGDRLSYRGEKHERRP